MLRKTFLNFSVCFPTISLRINKAPSYLILCNKFICRTEKSRNMRIINLIISVTVKRSQTTYFHLSYCHILSLMLQIVKVWKYHVISKGNICRNPDLTQLIKCLKLFKNAPNYLFLFLSTTSTSCQSCLQTTT